MAINTQIGELNLCAALF